MKAMKKLLSLVLAIAMIFSIAATPAFAANGYSDVPAGQWYEEAVNYVTAAKLMDGTGNGKFAPMSDASRAMVVTILWRMEGSPEATATPTFTDLEQDWYKKAVAWANETGVVNGRDEKTFDPNTSVSRQELATMMYRYAVKCRGEQEILGGSLVGRGFADWETISDWAFVGMVWSINKGLINGVEQADGSALLEPKGTANRAQLATVLMRLHGKVTAEAHKHTLAYVPAAEACHVPGTAEYWYCTDCEAVFADEAATILTNRKNLAIAPVCGLTHVEAVEAGCHQNGSAEYWFCEKCDAVYADAEGTQLTNRKNLTIPATKGLIHVPAAEAGCFDGNLEYWYCDICMLVSVNAEGTALSNLKNVTIPGGHTYGEDGICTVCEMAMPGTAGNPIAVIPEEKTTPWGDVLLGGLFEVPADETVYFQTRVENMTITFENAYALNITAEGAEVSTDMWGNVVVKVPAFTGFGPVPYVTLAITNNDTEYAYDNMATFESVVIGTWETPEAVADLAAFSVSIEEGNGMGYYFSWTATEAGTLTISAADYVVGYFDVDLGASSSYAYPYMNENDGTEAEGTVSINVKADDVVTIHIAAMPDAEWNIPAVETTLSGSFVAAE